MMHTVIGLKSEFEAEGLTHLEIADFFSRNPGPELRVIKLGGCEAKTDFRAAARLGANVIVAPMIESWFAAKKFASMYPHVKSMQRWINIETVGGVNNVSSILRACLDYGISGVVIGRGDLTESLGLDRLEVEASRVQNLVVEVASLSKQAGLHVGVGGMVGIGSEENLNELIRQGVLDHFETRKVLLSTFDTNIRESIRSALTIEFAWLDASLGNINQVREDLSSRRDRIESWLSQENG